MEIKFVRLKDILVFLAQNEESFNLLSPISSIDLFSEIFDNLLIEMKSSSGLEDNIVSDTSIRMVRIIANYYFFDVNKWNLEQCQHACLLLSVLRNNVYLIFLENLMMDFQFLYILDNKGRRVELEYISFLEETLKKLLANANYQSILLDKIFELYPESSCFVVKLIK